MTNIIDFPPSCRSPVDEAMGYALSVAGEIINSRTMKAPIGAVCRDDAQVREFWLSLRLDGAAGVWARYDDDEDRLIEEALLSHAYGDDLTETVLRRLRNCAMAFASAAIQQTETVDDPEIEIRFAPISGFIEVRANGVALAWWAAQNNSLITQKLH
ncbi:MAG: hypothetical protein AAF936_03900 [Pseudomonadota bacterium]